MVNVVGRTAPLGQGGVPSNWPVASCAVLWALAIAHASICPPTDSSLTFSSN